MKKKILIAGGHVTPAIALIEKLKQKDVDIIYVGRKYAMEGSKTVSVEFGLIQELGVRFLPIVTGRLQRSFTMFTLLSLLKIPIGLFMALRIVANEEPRVIVSFGGYVSLPLAIAGWVYGVPVILHEQTITPGLSNRIVGFLATRICVSFEEAGRYFDTSKVVVTGPPVRSALFKTSEKPPEILEQAKYPILFITGGSQGAASLNDLLFPIITRLTKHFTLIHQTGAESLRDAPKNILRYYAFDYIPTYYLSWIYKNATVVIGRSGANTIAELALFGKVALLVPLPWSAGGEQRKNAQWLTTHGGARVCDQQALTPQKLYDEIMEVSKNSTSLQKQASILQKIYPTDGAEKLVQEVL